MSFCLLYILMYCIHSTCFVCIKRLYFRYKKKKKSSSVLALRRPPAICPPVWCVPQIWGRTWTCSLSKGTCFCWNETVNVWRLKYHVPVMMSSRAPSFPSRTCGFTCLFFSSAIRSIWGILGIWGPCSQFNKGTNKHQIYRNNFSYMSTENSS